MKIEHGHRGGHHVRIVKRLEHKLPVPRHQRGTPINVEVCPQEAGRAPRRPGAGPEATNDLTADGARVQEHRHK
jgi:hypothetical protein